MEVLEPTKVGARRSFDHPTMLSQMLKGTRNAHCEDAQPLPAPTEGESVRRETRSSFGAPSTSVASTTAPSSARLGQRSFSVGCVSSMPESAHPGLHSQPISFGANTALLLVDLQVRFPA